MMRRGEDKHRFRSIVHAVQAGIFVERFVFLVSCSLALLGLVWFGLLDVTVPLISEAYKPLLKVHLVFNLLYIYFVIS